MRLTRDASGRSYPIRYNETTRYNTYVAEAINKISRELKIPAYWRQATRELASRDPVMARITAHPQALTLRSRGDAFATLARAIVGQQISVKAAQSVWNRVVERAGKITPANLSALDVDALRSCGLSSQKTAYLGDLAARFQSGALKPRRWSSLEDEVLIGQLTEVKGIGRWTAEMFLIFYLARPNVLPLDDIGLQRAMRLQYNKGRPLSRARMERIARVWAPWRSVATWYLWRSLEAAPA